MPGFTGLSTDPASWLAQKDQTRNDQMTQLLGLVIQQQRDKKEQARFEQEQAMKMGEFDLEKQKFGLDVSKYGLDVRKTDIDERNTDALIEYRKQMAATEARNVPEWQFRQRMVDALHKAGKISEEDWVWFQGTGKLPETDRLSKADIIKFAQTDRDFAFKTLDSAIKRLNEQKKAINPLSDEAREALAIWGKEAPPLTEEQQTKMSLLDKQIEELVVAQQALNQGAYLDAATLSKIMDAHEGRYFPGKTVGEGDDNLVYGVQNPNPSPPPGDTKAGGKKNKPKGEDIITKRDLEREAQAEARERFVSNLKVKTSQTNEVTVEELQRIGLPDDFPIHFDENGRKYVVLDGKKRYIRE